MVRQSLVNSEARLELKQLDEKFEPKWMFLQAEHFAKCICIPKDKLAQMLETIPLTNSWRPIYELAKNFGVSASVMKSRLKQLDVIKIENDRPNPNKRWTTLSSWLNYLVIDFYVAKKYWILVRSGRNRATSPTPLLPFGRGSHILAQPVHRAWTVIDI